MSTIIFNNIVDNIGIAW